VLHLFRLPYNARQATWHDPTCKGPTVEHSAPYALISHQIRSVYYTTYVNNSEVETVGLSTAYTRRVKMLTANPQPRVLLLSLPTFSGWGNYYRKAARVYWHCGL